MVSLITTSILLNLFFVPKQLQKKRCKLLLRFSFKSQKLLRIFFSYFYINSNKPTELKFFFKDFDSYVGFLCYLPGLKRNPRFCVARKRLIYFYYYYYYLILGLNIPTCVHIHTTEKTVKIIL